MSNTINIDVEIIYFWFDHILLRENGDAEKFTKAIVDGDYETFMKYYDYYNNKYKYEYDNNGGMICFFPDKAAIFYQNEFVGHIDITSPLGFSMITFSEYECG